MHHDLFDAEDLGLLSWGYAGHPHEAVILRAFDTGHTLAGLSSMATCSASVIMPSLYRPC